jgi:hypothetical protein
MSICASNHPSSVPFNQHDEQVEGCIIIIIIIIISAHDDDL